MTRLYNKINNIVPNKESQATHDVSQELLVTIVETLDDINVMLSKNQQKKLITIIKNKLKLI